MLQKLKLNVLYYPINLIPKVGMTSKVRKFHHFELCCRHVKVLIFFLDVQEIKQKYFNLLFFDFLLILLKVLLNNKTLIQITTVIPRSV